MKKYLLIFVLSVPMVAMGADGRFKKPATLLSSATTTAPSAENTGAMVFPTIVNNAFWEGEQLKFIIKYEFVTAGTAEMNVVLAEPVNGRPTFHIETRAASTKTVDKFFKVRDFNAATVDRASLLSRSFHQNLKEGGYAVIRTTTFDYDNKQYVFERTRKGKTNVSTGTVKAPLMDVLGAFFYTRTLPLHPGDEIFLSVFSDGDMYPLAIKVSPKLQKISVPAGKFECIKIEPSITGDAIFKASDGKMQIWLTNDEYRMPVLIRSKVFIGSFDAELQSFVRPPKPGFDTSETK